MIGMSSEVEVKVPPVMAGWVFSRRQKCEKGRCQCTVSTWADEARRTEARDLQACCASAHNKTAQ